MADEPQKIPEVGELAIDISPLASFIKDLAPGEMQGMRREQSGFPDVYKELSGNRKHLPSIGVTSQDLQAILEGTERIALVRLYLPAARKLVELLEETEASLDDERHRAISAIAGTVELRAKRDRNPTLLATYEKTLAYRSAIALKAAKTRQRNARAEEETPTEPGTAA